MWLPKDERKLLAFYFRSIGKPDEPETLQGFDDMKALGWIETLSDDGYDKEYSDKVCHADVILQKRGFISVDRDIMDKTISLTVEGYDLGRKYSSWWTRSGLWFAEYKNHWFWLIVSFLGGIIGALIVNWLSRVD